MNHPSKSNFAKYIHLIILPKIPKNVNLYSCIRHTIEFNHGASTLFYPGPTK